MRAWVRHLAIFIFCRCACAACADFDHCGSADCNTVVRQR